MRRLSEQRSTWLLVYDNVPTPDAVANLLPSAGARVLITSRFSDWSEQADEIALDVLPLEEAVALLENRAGRSDAAGAKTLAEAVDRLPLRAFITSAKAPPLVRECSTLMRLRNWTECPDCARMTSS
jgi:hypothetical protein